MSGGGGITTGSGTTAAPTIGGGGSEGGGSPIATIGGGGGGGGAKFMVLSDFPENDVMKTQRVAGCWLRCVLQAETFDRIMIESTLRSKGFPQNRI